MREARPTGTVRQRQAKRTFPTHLVLALEKEARRAAVQQRGGVLFVCSWMVGHIHGGQLQLLVCSSTWPVQMLQQQLQATPHGHCLQHA